MQQQLISAVAAAALTRITGIFQRHCSPDVQKLRGSPGGGRWGPPGAYSVIYLGRPERTIVVEAYRHLVDDDLDGLLTGDMVGPRNLLTLEVDVPEILDLRQAASQQAVGLDAAALASPVGQYALCERVGQAAHQLGLYGIIAPAATGMGETLALFEERLPQEHWPVLQDTTRWEHLPADPRRLRIVG
ncbi:MAG: RES domain-containing protein [Solirubrobacteraceae bacterium]